MDVNFHIKELGPIKDFKFELKPFMIFSGESSTGKSYASFLIYFLNKALLTETLLEPFFKSCGTIPLDYDLLPSNIDKNIEFSIEVSKFREWLNSQAGNFISYLIAYDELKCDVDINIDFKFKEFKINIDSHYIKDIQNENGEEEIVHTISINDLRCVSIQSNTYPLLSALKHAFSSYFKQSMFERNIIPFLLPPSRGGFMALNHTGKDAFLSSSGMYNELMEQIDSLGKFGINLYKMPITLQKLMSDIIGGNITQRNNKIVYATKEGIELPISAAASSIKELVPIFLILQRRTIEHISMLFEEPESHLHPELQTKVAELLIYMIQNGGNLQITTHSDYILSRISDTIRQYHLQQAMPSDKYKKFCNDASLDENLVLDPNDVGAYCFKKNENGDTIWKKQDLDDIELLSSFEKVIDNRLERSFNIREQLENLESDATDLT